MLEFFPVQITAQFLAKNEPTAEYLLGKKLKISNKKRLILLLIFELPSRTFDQTKGLASLFKPVAACSETEISNQRVILHSRP